MSEPNYILLASGQYHPNKEGLFSEIFLKYYAVLCYFGEKFLGNKEEAEDIVMKVFDQLWSAQETFPTESAMRSYLYTSVKNGCLNFIKYTKVRKDHQPALSYLMDQADSGIHDKIVMAELLGKIYQEIELLPAKCRNVFKLAYLDGMSHPEIAAHLNISTDNVKAQKARAIQLLRIVLLRKELLIQVTVALILLEWIWMLFNG